MGRSQQEGHTGSPQLMRHLNAARVLEHMWGSEPATASELMAATGLTRATVLAICRDLTAQGWLQRVEDSRRAGSYSKGRPALRYAFRAETRFVVGVDAAQDQVRVVIADLSGREVARANREMHLGGSAVESGQEVGKYRRIQILAAVDHALESAGIEAEQVEDMVLGVPAPVDAQGRSPVGLNEFWGQMNPDLISLAAGRGWSVAVENDANLAAIAEQQRLSEDTDFSHGDRSFAVLLSGEGIGSGVVLRGELLRQSRGTAGELGILDLVRGVESTFGLSAWARWHAQEAIRGGEAPGSVLADLSLDELEAQSVLAAAEQGDELAGMIVERLGDRLARICTVLAGLLDLDKIILSGPLAPQLAQVVTSAETVLSNYLYAPWLQIATSELGADAVRLGAVQFSVDRVKRRALQEVPV